MHEFSYCAPGNLRDAADALAAHAPAVRVLAGGTDLVVAMRTGRRQPHMVIDLKQIPELTRIELSPAGLVLGAAASCRRICRQPDLATTFPALVDAAGLIGGIQIQGRASMGGNLCNAAPSADTVPALIAYGAVARISGSAGERSVKVEEFCLGPGKTVLGGDEILVDLALPLPAGHSGASFLRFTPRNEMDIAVVNAAVHVQLDAAHESFVAARIALGAVGPTPLFVEAAGKALCGRPVHDDTIAEAARIAAEAATPIDDMRGTVAHRRQLAAVLVARATKRAVERARGNSR